ncbi:MAG: DUF2849 domain-containing protein [Pseudomonadota bacterium]
MAKAFQPSVFTANDLIEGDAVYLGETGWVRDVRDAAVAATAAALSALEARAEAGIAANEVVGIYALPVSLEAGAPWPVTRREQIKASRNTTIAVGPAAQPARLSDAA